jgi:5'-nucleotidase
MINFSIPSDLRNSRILISNDDSVNAEGIKVLTEVMRKFSDDVWVVAPSTEQSGAGHSLTLHQPLRVNQLEERIFSVTGTPTDCVLLAVKEIIPKDKTISLVVSGVNHGDNMAEHVTYSGTIAATMEATLLGIPAIAFSRSINAFPLDWQTTKQAVAKVMKGLQGAEWHGRSLLSVNIPDCAPNQLGEIKVVRQGSRSGGDAVHVRTDPRGRTYYWIGGTDYSGITFEPETDCAAVEANNIAITPISMDLTNYDMLAQLDQHLNIKDAA